MSDRLRITRRSAVAAGAGIMLIGASAAGRGTTLNARDFGARGDGKADDFPALQRFLNALAARGGRGVIPEGVYLCSDHPSFIDVSPPATIRITCKGRIKMSARGTWGGVFLVRNSRNIMWEGGIFDGGGMGLDGKPLGNNGWAMSGMPHTGKRSTHDIYISGMLLTNCRASPKYLGGKGFSLQRGVEKCQFDLMIHDCDFGATLEASAVDERSYIRQINLKVDARNCRLGGLLLTQGQQDTYSADSEIMSAKVVANLQDCGTWEADGRCRVVSGEGRRFMVDQCRFDRNDTVRLVDSQGNLLGVHPLYAIPQPGGGVMLANDMAGVNVVDPALFDDVACIVPDGWAAILLDRAQNITLNARVSTTRTAPMTVMRGRMSNSTARVTCDYPYMFSLWDTMRHGLKNGRIPSRPGSVRSVNNCVEFAISGAVNGSAIKAYRNDAALLQGTSVTVRGGKLGGATVFPKGYEGGNVGRRFPAP